MPLVKTLSCLILTLSVLEAALGKSILKPSMSQLTVEKHPSVVDASVGENIVLDCKVEGSPGPLLHWERNGKIISQDLNQDFTVPDQVGLVREDDDDYSSVKRDSGRRLRMSSTRSRLYVDCVSKSDAGEYVCVASTPKQTVRTTTKLIVDSSRSIRTCVKEDPKHLKSSRIYMWTSSSLEYEGGTVQLFCRVLGSPAPQVVWLDPKDKIIKNNDKYQLMKNGDLLIKNVSWSANMGFYRCIAKNDDGIDEVSTFLYPMAS